ncbi:MAG TPA: hypothetical protein VHV10_12245 [Ktedonobacteraceae bacterium]|nr:hypothetical protein [Ktedonobacteraceae bacterium]
MEKHQTSFIKRCRGLPRLLLRAFLLGMLLTESLAVMAGFGLPTAAAYPHWSKSEEGKGKPDLFISKSHLGGDHFQVGDNITFIIVVGNDSRVRSTTSTITVLDNIPIGMRNLQASGHDWDITTSHRKSPARITAKYRGNGSVDGGEILPAIKISGKLTEDAIPHFTNTATVHTKCDCDLSNNKVTDTIFVKQARYGQKSNACDNEKKSKREGCRDKSKDSVQGESSNPNTENNTTTPSTSSATAISAVAIANVNNIFGGVGGGPGFGGVGSTPGLGGVGSAPDSSETGDVPGLPNTGSDPGSTADTRFLRAQ